MKKSGPRLYWRKILVAFVLIALLLPGMEVLAVRFMDPPFTPLMVLRQIEKMDSQVPAPRPSYRWIPLSRCPESFLKAVWTMEDARFFAHDGFDWKEVQIALAEAKASGKPARGASTISMQCARSLFLWQGRSWVRKPIEAYYTILMETMLTKRRILELYVNVIETGDRLYGIEAAAQHYYRCPARNLTREQSAMIAAILPNPRVWNPQNPSVRVKHRQQIVLKRSSEAHETPWRSQ